VGVDGAGFVTDPAPFVDRLVYKPGWSFKIGGPNRSMLCVFATTADSLRRDRTRTTQHQFPLPQLPCTVADFTRWVLERLLQAEHHEACEFLTIDGFHPFWPHHQDDGSPYELVERWESP
jgi:hypothetical protein